MTRGRMHDARHNHMVPLVPAWNVRGKLLDKVIAFHADIGAPMKAHSMFDNHAWRGTHLDADLIEMLTTCQMLHQHGTGLVYLLLTCLRRRQQGK
jgi:hypothetical protein